HVQLTRRVLPPPSSALGRTGNLSAWASVATGAGGRLCASSSTVVVACTAWVAVGMGGLGATRAHSFAGAAGAEFGHRHGQGAVGQRRAADAFGREPPARGAGVQRRQWARLGARVVRGLVPARARVARSQPASTARSSLLGHLAVGNR